MRRLYFISFTLLTVVLSSAGFGIRLATGLDWTLSMENTTGLGEQVSTDTIFLTTDRITIRLLPGEVPIFVSRTQWKRHLLNLSTGLYFDTPFTPLIDRIALSATLAVWEYNGVLWYADSLNPQRNLLQILADPGNQDNFQFKSEPVTLESRNRNFLGLEKTPFFRLHTDLSLYRSIPVFPALHSFTLYLGGGLSLNFSSPTLSAQFVGESLNQKLGDSTDIEGLDEQISEKEITRYILDKVTDRLTNPSTALHAALFLELRPPNAPLGFSGELKYFFPLSSIDPDIYLGGYGFTLNAGLSLYF